MVHSTSDFKNHKNNQTMTIWYPVCLFKLITGVNASSGLISERMFICSSYSYVIESQRVEVVQHDLNLASIQTLEHPFRYIIDTSVFIPW